MKNIKLTLEYDGSNFFGWQKQKGLRTGEGELEKAILKATGESVKIFSSGRTDKGVHAYSQVVNFLVNSTIPGEKYRHPINDKLPKDIYISKSEEVDIDFHSRFDAKSKTYKYLILNRKLKSPIMRNYAYFVDYELSFENMKKGLEYLVGRYDFSSFVALRSNENKNIRTIYNIEIKKNGEFLEFYFKGNGFLHNMVRIIIGTTIEIGYGRRKPEEMKEILESKDRKKAGHTAPAEGLYLMEVEY